MKSLLAATVILITITAAVAVGGIRIQRALSDTIDTLLRLPEELPATVQEPAPIPEFFRQWEAVAKIASVTVPANRLETISRSAKEMESAAFAGDGALYRKARADLLLLLLEVRKAEGFSLVSIF